MGGGALFVGVLLMVPMASVVRFPTTAADGLAMPIGLATVGGIVGTVGFALVVWAVLLLVRVLRGQGTNAIGS